MSTLSDPVFWALAAGFSLILAGCSPLLRHLWDGHSADTGCAMILCGIGIVAAATVIKVLG